MLGKWSNEHIVKSYVNGIPLNAVLARAGFQNHVHMISQSTVEAPQELLDCACKNLTIRCIEKFVLLVEVLKMRC